MSFFEKFEAAIGNKDLDAMMELMHPDWTMVMHSTGKVLDLNDWKEMFSKIIAGDNFKRENVRCIYENDDIMVAHSIATFPNGTTDAVMYVGILKDGRLFRTETGSTPINKQKSDRKGCLLLPMKVLAILSRARVVALSVDF